MVFKIKIFLLGLFLSNVIFTSSALAVASVMTESSSFINSVAPVIESNESDNLKYESKPRDYTSQLDPLANCSGWSFWCNTKFGVKHAVSQGVDGIMINGYAYHPVAGWHWPTGYDADAKLNELTIGAGYTRTYYNPQYNTEYILYGMAFEDSFYKPEVHVGYAYQKYFDLNDSGGIKWGIGYTPFIFVKSSMVGDAPIPFPAVGLMTSVKWDKFNLMLTYFNVFFLNARIDL